MALAIDLQSPPVDVNAPLDECDIQLVQVSFAQVARLGAKNVGKLLFMQVKGVTLVALGDSTSLLLSLWNIFKVAPGAVDLFPFARGEANLYRLAYRAYRMLHIPVMAAVFKILWMVGLRQWDSRLGSRGSMF
ncbi:ngb2 [Symbiodinium sp. KB8]|nr:ngb2 [Symbiodinium sp. KB8]